MEIIQTENGLHLKDSILWLDGECKKSQLNFISSIESYQQFKHSPQAQVITSYETAKLITPLREAQNALICEFNRPFSVGNLELELIPSGHIFGGSMLRIKYQQESLLYAPVIQTKKTNIQRQIQVGKSDTLLLGANNLDSSGHQSIKKEYEKLREFVSQKMLSGTQRVNILCSLSISSDLTHFFSNSEIKVVTHHDIYRLNKAYEDSGRPVGKYTLFKGRASLPEKPCVVLFPFKTQLGSHIRTEVPDGSVAVIDDSRWNPIHLDALRIPEYRTKINSAAGISEIKKFIKCVDPKKIILFGPYSKAMRSNLSEHHANTNEVYKNHQPSLF